MLLQNVTRTRAPFRPLSFRALAGGLLFTIAFYQVVSPSAFASFVSSNVSASPVSGPAVTQGTGVPGQTVTATVDAQNFAQALTNYGVNKSFATSSYYQDFAQASSDWMVSFSLSGNGLPPNSFVPLTISYSYDFSLITSSGFGSPSTGYIVGATFGLSGNNGDQGHPYDVFSVSATSNADGSVESCKSKVPGAATPQQCLGSYNGSGDLLVLNNFHIGQNHLESQLQVGAAIGTTDGFNTGLITGIVVPDGFTWTYDDNISGNPLNFHYASVAGVPEPATFGILGLGLAALTAARMRRARPTA